MLSINFYVERYIDCSIFVYKKNFGILPLKVLGVRGDPYYIKKKIFLPPIFTIVVTRELKSNNIGQKKLEKNSIYNKKY